MSQSSARGETLNQQHDRGQHAAHRLAIALLVVNVFAPLSWAAASRNASSALYVTAQTVQAWLTHGQQVLFLDVRESDEFAAGHLPGALNIAYDQVATLTERLPHDQPVVLYCIHSTHRAPAAASALRTLGFTNAYVLDGGIVAWQAGGLTIHASDLAKAPTILPFTGRCAQPRGRPKRSPGTFRL